VIGAGDTQGRGLFIELALGSKCRSPGPRLSAANSPGRGSHRNRNFLASLAAFRAPECVRSGHIILVTSFVFNDFLASFPRFCVSHCRGNPCGCPWAATRAAPTGAEERLAQTCSPRSVAFAGWGGGATSSAPPGVSCPPPSGSPESFRVSASFASKSEARDFFLLSCISSSSRIFRSSCRCSAFCCRMVSAHCACEGAMAAMRAACVFSTCS
jgi:hypothetical protein